MDDKSKQEFTSVFDDKDLTFTKEDRIKTLKKIRERDRKNHSKNIDFLPGGKRFIGPLLGSIALLFLAVGLILPTLYSSKDFSKEDANEQQADRQKRSSFSALVLGKDSPEHGTRSSIHLLLTYNSSNNSMKLVPIPRDTYTEIFNAEGKGMGKDKLMHASALSSTPDPAITTVSNLFNVPIDYYFTLPKENIYTELEISRDDIRNGNIPINVLGNYMKERLSFSKMKKLMENSETNIPSDFLHQLQKADNNSESIQVIDMEKGIEETRINGVYYVKINQELLDKTSNTLKQHLGDKE